jgi:mannose-6-phosphate isomerase class I
VRGRPLSEALGRPLPLLVKLIDTRVPLSVQVHPDDSAERPGKEEAWVVIDADPGAHVLAGARPGLGAAELAALTRAALAESSRGRDLAGALSRIDVTPGTVVLVPAGTVHVIGAGITLAEIQQPVDRTYRLFDYGSGRELHVEAALAAARVEARPLRWQPGEAPTELRGKHLRLWPCVAGRSSFHAATSDHVIVCVRPPVSLQDETLATGDLRLCVGGEYELQVGEAGLAVGGEVWAP